MAGGGGSSTTETTVPNFLETGYQQGIGMGRDLSAMPYTPFYGPDVAALSPLEQASFQGTDVMAGAFGMPSSGGQQYLPAPTQFEGGAMGYSSAPIFEQAVGELETRRPAQADYYNSFFIDPVTGKMGSRALEKQPVALEMQSGGRRGK